MIISLSGKKMSGKDTVAKMWQYLDLEEREYGFEGRGSLKPDKIPLWIFPKSTWEVKKWATKVKEVAALILGIDPQRFEEESFKSQKMDERWKRYIFHTSYGRLVLSSKQEVIKHINNPEINPEVYAHIPTYREFLQEIGTDAFRDVIHPSTWVNALMAEYKPINWKSGTDDPIYPNWLITDTRFPNEVEGADTAPDKVYHIRVERNTELRLPNLWNEFQGSDFEEWELFLKAKGKYKDVYHRSETALDSKDDWGYIINNNGSLEDLFQEVKHLKEEVLEL